MLVGDQAVRDLRLLLKLNYSGSYVKYEGVLLEKETRLRLALLGNALEFREWMSALRQLGKS